MFSSFAFACIGGRGYLPENDMHLDIHYKSLNGGGITKSEFNAVLDRLNEVYAPIISQYGGTLKINRLWDDGTVNASANREGRNYVINMFGGLARHDVITKDGFALVACHEVGHHIGGVPKYSDPQGRWASVEGQSDYFATTKCLRKLFMNDDNSTIVRGMNIPSEVESKCESQFNAQNDQDICKRIAMAGLSGASLFANGSPPKFTTPDPSQVQVTYESHPQPQCRLDTYYAGGICEIDEDIEIGQNDPNIGTCNRQAGQNLGMRPLCWFKPASTGGGQDPNDPPSSEDVATTPTVYGQTTYQASNPNQMIPIKIDVRGQQGASGFAIEVSKPNSSFSNPNSKRPDRRNGLWVQSFRGVNGDYRLLPARQLPGWGRYEIRVIALGNRGQPVSKNSNPLYLVLRR